MDTAIELKNVTYKYPLCERPAINGVSLSLAEGRMYGVIGANGSGKTTLCALIRGFAPCFYKGELTGEVLVRGKPTTAYGPGELALIIGYVFQNPFNQISGVKETVFEEVAFGLENYGTPVGEIEQRVTDAMRLTNISHLAEKNPFALSGGQQQRMALASVIALSPDILVIDEPTSQLDPEGAEGVFEIIRAMKKDRKTIILVEHKIDLIAEYADEIVVLDGGRVIRSGDKQHILSDESLINANIQLPRVSLFGFELRKRGIALDYIPITEAQGADVISKALD